MTRRLTVLALALVLALSLTGCWEAEPEPDDFWGDELPPEEQETSQREPAQISDFTLPYLSGQTFDPVTCIDGVQQTVGALLYERSSRSTLRSRRSLCCANAAAATPRR